MRLFVASAPGLESLLGEELQELGFAPGSLTQLAGGVEVETDLDGTYRILFGCRVGLSVRRRLATFRTTHFAHLEKQLSQLSWSEWLPAGQPVVVRASSRSSRLYHTGGIAERVGRVVTRAVGACDGPSESGASASDPPPLLVHARMERDQLSLSVDLCGDPLHRRGYRQQTGKAPLREDLAAALLRVAGYDGSVPIIDPLCGSGTLVIEAGLIATGVPPGRGRSFAIERLPFHDPDNCARARARCAPTRCGTQAGPRASIIGNDRDAGAIAAAAANAGRAGLGDSIAFACHAISNCALPAADTGLIVTNPPYGRRIGRRTALRDLYASLGALCKRAGPGFRLALITSEPALAHATGLKLTPVCLTDLGGTKVRLYREVPGREA